MNLPLSKGDETIKEDARLCAVYDVKADRR